MIDFDSLRKKKISKMNIYVILTEKRELFIYFILVQFNIIYLNTDHDQQNFYEMF